MIVYAMAAICHPQQANTVAGEDCINKHELNKPPQSKISNLQSPIHPPNLKSQICNLQSTRSQSKISNLQSPIHPPNLKSQICNLQSTYATG